MLNYKPVWLIMGKVTEDNEVLTEDLIVQTIFYPAERKANTSSRRAQTLKSWIMWIAGKTLIPIHLRETVQLPLPLLFSESS
jgi:hypothetical protein